ncbi:MAG TPA: peptide deformylase, partial [Candidatus Paceibacterota bacterium]|nr:peptide deformylase [Candidatus Paceibacterota bacterium]
MLARTQFGDPVLARRARPVPRSFLRTEQFRALVRDMFFTMRRANGVGLAAPQIGRSLQLAVIEVKPSKVRPDVRSIPPTVIVNPRIVERSKAYENDWEGCLSLGGVRGKVPRHRTIKVRYEDALGNPRMIKLAGFSARVFQHEIDHL